VSGKRERSTGGKNGEKHHVPFLHEKERKKRKKNILSLALYSPGKKKKDGPGRIRGMFWGEKGEEGREEKPPISRVEPTRKESKKNMY